MSSENLNEMNGGPKEDPEDAKVCLNDARKSARYAETAAERADVAVAAAEELLSEMRGVAAQLEVIRSETSQALNEVVAYNSAAESSARDAGTALTLAKDESAAATTARVEAQASATAAEQASQLAHSNSASSATELDAAKQAANSAGAELTTCQEHSRAVSVLLDQIQQTATVAAEDAAKTRGIAETAENVSSRVAEYEAKLAALEKRFGERERQIEGLLPGATSAGLASDFRDQQQTYVWPKRGWALLFLIAIIGMLLTVFLAPHERWMDSITNPYEGLFVNFLHRSPYFVPLGLLAYFAYRYFGLADRLQQDYAYKERLSSTFEGYKSQMGQIQVPPGSPSPLTVLCTKVLHVIGQHPARFYDRNHTEEMPPALQLGQVLEVPDQIARRKPKAPVVADRPLDGGSEVSQ